MMKDGVLMAVTIFISVVAILAAAWFILSYLPAHFPEKSTDIPSTPSLVYDASDFFKEQFSDYNKKLLIVRYKAYKQDMWKLDLFSEILAIQHRTLIRVSALEESVQRLVAEQRKGE